MLLPATRSISCFTVFAVTIAGVSSTAWSKPAPNAGRPLRVAYFVPADREPEANFSVRLDRVMTHIQMFYRNGMRMNGLGPMTFHLDRGKRNELNIIMVKGRELMAAYNPESKDKIRDEVRREFEKIGLDLEQEVVIVFQALLQRQPGKTTEFGPFKGGGNGYKGSALVFDDIRLDAALCPKELRMQRCEKLIHQRL